MGGSKYNGKLVGNELGEVIFPKWGSLTRGLKKGVGGRNTALRHGVPPTPNILWCASAYPLPVVPKRWYDIRCPPLQVVVSWCSRLLISPLFFRGFMSLGVSICVSRCTQSLIYQWFPALNQGIPYPPMRLARSERRAFRSTSPG